MITLRDYQQQGVAEIRAEFRKPNVNSVLYVAPTGAGKTVLFSYVAKSVTMLGNRVLVLVHRKELRKQASGEFLNFAVPHGIIANGMPVSKANVQVATIQGIARKIHLLGKFDLVVVDEAHHSVSKSWVEVLGHLVARGSKVLGVTATPYRGDGTGLGEFYDVLVPGPQPAELIEMGHLSPFKVYAPPTVLDLKGLRKSGDDYNRGELEERVDKPTITGDIVGHYLKLAKGKRAICFTVSIKHAQHLAAEFNRRGVTAEAIDGTMSDEQRDAIIGRFERGDTLILLSCDLVSEGFNCPAAEVGILGRPSLSRALVRQQIGRILRLSPGKEEAIIIDHVGNIAMHGFPDDPDIYSLMGKEKSKGGGTGGGGVTVSVCKKCFASFRPAPKCPNCGAEIETNGREIQEVAGELVEVDRVAQQKKRRIEEARAETLDELIALGTARGYQYPEAWAKHKIRAREAKQRA